MIEIKRMQKEDLPEIEKMYVELVPDGCPVETLAKNLDKMTGEHYYPMVAKEDGEVVGTAVAIVCIAPDTPFMVVENVVVKEEHRGKHIGSRLFAEIDRYAREQKCQYSILVSSAFRKEAHAFYEAVGYTDEVVGFRKVYS